MKKYGFPYADKALLLPAIVTLSLFLFSLGIRGPIIPAPQKPKFHFRAVTEMQSKAARAGIEKQKEPLVLSLRAPLTTPSPILASIAHLEEHGGVLNLVATVPSRASPLHAT